MMYSMPSCVNAERIDIPVNNKLSDMDKAYIRINYPRKKTHPKAEGWTLEKALTVAGVPAKEIIAYLGRDDESIRQEFNAWNILQHWVSLQSMHSLTAEPRTQEGNINGSKLDQVSPLLGASVNECELRIVHTRKEPWKYAVMGSI
ncbi:hypothetical protein H0H81_010070 [Sphagnurus paluster]|uniref:Uncharacterized protein n=1 Tax=Sphagnurus paluster TaxID=117069 RepID=A0A9P7FPJ1_9AGAR|nr:hypothetical protein H0H81_010070 [Sphagnurus paluster]